jgi:EpsI family protein
MVSLASARWDASPMMITQTQIRPPASWTKLDVPARWQPALHNPAGLVSGCFAKQGRTVCAHIGVFGRSTPQSKLTSASNRLLEPDGLDTTWRLARQGRTHAQSSDFALDVNMAVLVGRETRLLAWQWYWVDGTATGNALHALLLQLQARLQGRPETSGWVAIHTQDDVDAGEAARVLQEFVADMATPIDEALRAPAAQRLMAQQGL